MDQWRIRSHCFCESVKDMEPAAFGPCTAVGFAARATAVSRQMILLVMDRDVSRSSTEFRQLDLLGLEALLPLHDLKRSTFQY